MSVDVGNKWGVASSTYLVWFLVRELTDREVPVSIRKAPLNTEKSSWSIGRTGSGQLQRKQASGSHSQNW